MKPNIPVFQESHGRFDYPCTKNMLVKNAAYRVANVFVVLLTTVLLSRLAGAQGYGMLTLFIANVVVFNLFTSFGAESGLLYHRASDKLSRFKLLRLLHYIVAGQLVLLALVEGMSYFFYGHPFLLNSTNGNVYILIVLFVLGTSLSEKYAALLNGSGRYTLFSQLQLITNLCMLFVFCMVYFFAEPLSAISYITIYVVLAFIQAIVYIGGFYGSTKDKTAVKAAVQKQEAQFFFSYALLAFITNALQFVAYRIDLWFIDYYYTDTELGLYGLAIRLVQLFWVLPLVVAGVLYPVIAAAKKQPDIPHLLFVVRTLFVGQLIVAFCIYAFMPWGIQLVFGQEFLGSVVPFYWLLPGVLLFGIATIVAAYFSGIDRLWVNFFASVICLGCIAIGDWLLVPEMGIRGAAIAGMIGYSVTTIYYLLTFSARHKISLNKILLPQKGDWPKIKKAVAQLVKNKE